MNIHELAKRHENDHPGYILTDWYDAAFPSYEIYLRVLMQVEQPLPAIDQFVLRALEVKVNTVEDISGIYGLEHTITYDALERLQRDGFISIVSHQKDNGKRETLSITQKGRNILQTMAFMRPEEDNLNICLDALTGEYYPHRRLYTGNNIKNADLFQIPAYLTMLEYDQIEIVRLNRVWLETRRSLPKSDQSKELLDVLEIENWFLGYRTMRVLQYINRNNGNLIVHVYDGAERSSRHEIALLKMEEEGLHSLRAEVKRGPEEIPDPIIEVIDEELFQAAKRKALEIPKLEQNISKKEQQIEETEDIKRTSPKNEDSLQSDQQERELREEINRLKQQINQLEEAAPTIRILSMTEHRPMLLEALRDTKRRVVIVSPWLSPTAVDQELRTLIEQTIARGVEVWMGYGFGDPDHREEHTLKLLHRIQKGRGGKNLRLRRLAESHAKVVICDEAYMITTSFNWLSFAGDPNRGNRVEFGTLTRDPKAVRAMLDRILPMFEESQKNIVL